MKQKTNISVKNILGLRITPSMEIGSGGDYASGDILDANATNNLINKKVANIVGLAPETLDTLEEIADLIDSKANTSDLSEINTALQSLSNSFNAFQTQFNNSDLINRVSALEDKVESLLPKVYAVGDILYSDGTITAEIIESKTAVGICVAPASEFADGKARFMSLLKMIYNNYDYIEWESLAGSCGCGCGSSSYTETGLTNYQDEIAAKTDENGAANTNKLITLSSDFNAAKACKAYAPGVYDGMWYLPALGELYYAYSNYGTLSSILQLLGITSLYNSFCWSSTLRDLNGAFCLQLVSGDLYFGEAASVSKDYAYRVLAFVAI